MIKIIFVVTLFTFLFTNLFMVSVLPIYADDYSTGDYASKEDKAAMETLKKAYWVRDLYVSPGHMNVGVLRWEQDWYLSIIGERICLVLLANGSKLRWVRLVDIEMVVDYGKSTRQAEISKFKCQ